MAHQETCLVGQINNKDLWILMLLFIVTSDYLVIIVPFEHVSIYGKNMPQLPMETTFSWLHSHIRKKDKFQKNSFDLYFFFVGMLISCWTYLHMKVGMLF
jgi:predicted nucleic acid-binding Zn ribbon protein